MSELLYAGSRAGRGHEESQDAFAVLQSDSCAVVAVADGVGSRPRSREGAQLAVRLACEVGCDFLRGEPLSFPDGFAQCLRERWLACLPPGDPHDFATTLLCAGRRGSSSFVVMVGDGAVVVRLQDGSSLALFKSEEEWSNVVTPLSSPRAVEEVRGQQWRAETGEYLPAAVMLLTDGLSENVQLLPLLDGVLSRVTDVASAEATFAALVDRVSSADDMTMGLLVC